MSSLLSKYLYRKKITLQEACVDVGVEFVPGMQVEGLEECSHCSVWHKENELHPDSEGMPICRTCEGWYGN
jgi:hypothetical protein